MASHCILGDHQKITWVCSLVCLCHCVEGLVLRVAKLADYLARILARDALGLAWSCVHRNVTS